MPTYTNTKDTLNDSTGQKTLDKLVGHELTSFVDDGIQTLGRYALYKQTTQTSVNFPTVTNIGNNAFDGCSALQTVDIGGKTSIGSSAFANCPALQAILLRNGQASTLNSYDALAGSPVAKGTCGVYVTDNIISSYKTNSNWKPYSHMIFPISEYPKASLVTITDTWAQIIAASGDGTYDSKYNVGDTAYLQINNVNYIVQLVAKNADEKVGGGTANMTWLLRGIYATHKMSANMTGGWGSSDTDSMRNWLHNTVFGLLPSELQAEGVIKEVNKTYWDATANDNAGELKTSQDKIWIPSSREVCLTGGYLKETSGVQYSSIFSDNNSRIKFDSNGSAGYWWTRSASSAPAFVSVNGSGGGYINSPYGTNGAVFGFCL